MNVVIDTEANQKDHALNEYQCYVEYYFIIFLLGLLWNSHGVNVILEAKYNIYEFPNI